MSYIICKDCVYNIERIEKMTGSRFYPMMCALNNLYKRIGDDITELYSFDWRKPRQKLQNTALLIVDSEKFICQYKSVKETVYFEFLTAKQASSLDRWRRSCWRKYFKYKEEIRDGKFDAYTNDHQFSIDGNNPGKPYGLFDN